MAGNVLAGVGVANPSMLFGQIVALIFIVLVGLVVGGFAYFVARLLIRLLKYKIDVTVWEHVGNTDIPKKDMGRASFNEEKKKWLLLLMKDRKADVCLPDSDYFYGIGSRKMVDLHLFNGLYTPMKLAHNSPTAYTFNTDDLVSAMRWRELDHKENLETYRDRSKDGQFWAKYGGAFMTIAMIMIMFVLFFILIQKLGNLQIRVDTSQLIK